MKTRSKSVFQRLAAGETVPTNDVNFLQVVNACDETRKLLVSLNAAVYAEEIRDLLSKITGSEIDAATAMFPPFQINYRKNTRIGKNVFINFDCTFLDLGGIIIEDNVLIAPKVSL